MNKYAKNIALLLSVLICPVAMVGSSPNVPSDLGASSGREPEYASKYVKAIAERIKNNGTIDTKGLMPLLIQEIRRTIRLAKPDEDITMSDDTADITVLRSLKLTSKEAATVQQELIKTFNPLFKEKGKQINIATMRGFEIIDTLRKLIEQVTQMNMGNGDKGMTLREFMTSTEDENQHKEGFFSKSNMFLLVVAAAAAFLATPPIEKKWQNKKQPHTPMRYKGNQPYT